MPAPRARAPETRTGGHRVLVTQDLDRELALYLGLAIVERRRRKDGSARMAHRVIHTFAPVPPAGSHAGGPSAEPALV